MRFIKTFFAKIRLYYLKAIAKREYKKLMHDRDMTRIQLIQRGVGADLESLVARDSIRQNDRFTKAMENLREQKKKVSEYA